MFNFLQKPFFRFSLITACVLSWYQPEVAQASHHQIKKFKTVSHHHLAHKKSATVTTQTATNVDFTINPDNSVETNSSVIPAVTTTETTNLSSTEPTVAAAVEAKAELQTAAPSPPVPTHTFVTETTAPKNVIAVKPEQRLIPMVERIFTPVRAAPVYITRETVATTHVLGSFATSMHKHLVDFVQKTVETLRYSDYKLGGSKFDTSRGVYVVDCSSFVDHILKQVSPHAYTSLVNATGAPTPATQHYYEFFNELSNNSDNYWNRVNNVEQLRAGDILVFRNKQSHRHQAGGHIMVVMDKPTKDMGVYFVRVADSAPSRHSEDTRQKNEAGIGIGTLMLKAAKGGRPFAYAWAIGGLWNKNVNFAMARPTEWD
jgi:cell wall-associated NlpC family hydrolase